MKRAVAVVLLTLVALGATAAIQVRIDRLRGAEIDDVALYLPNENLLSHFTCGMSSVVADLLWIKCLKYTGKQFQGKHDFTWLNHMSDMITRLDPYFVPAYRYGAVFLAMLKADDDACIELLKKGMRNNPDAWELPYEIAMTYLLNRPNDPQGPVEAAKYLAMASSTGKAPGYVLEVAQSLQRGHNLVELEREMWESMLNSDDKLLRDMAERKLILVELRVACSNLTAAAERFAAVRGRAPKGLAEMVKEGLIGAAPEDPLGGEFFLDGTRVFNTSVLDEEVERARNVLRGGIDAFKEREGRYPASIEELKASNILNPFPDHPFPGRSWEYDRVTGEVKSGG